MSTIWTTGKVGNFRVERDGRDTIGASVPPRARLTTARMYFSVLHRTHYCYTEPVRLAAHTLRLRPRQQAGMTELRSMLSVQPLPTSRAEQFDGHGNSVTRLDFGFETTELCIESEFSVHTQPVAVGRDARAAGLSMHNLTLDSAYEAYRSPPQYAPRLSALSAQLLHETGGDLRAFLNALNLWLFRNVAREVRETGDPQEPEFTLHRRRGACRDLAVLFVDACRMYRLPARFVSGYQMGEGSRTRRYMHAWPEVYLPGIGWQGYDPTHGTLVDDAHVALAAAADSSNAAPIEGGFYGCAASTMTIDLLIEVTP